MDDRVVATGLVLTAAEQSLKQISEFDTARTRDALLMVVNYVTGPRMVEVDIVSGTVSPVHQGLGTRVHYSSDDSRILFISPHLAAGDYVSSLDPATGLITRLTKKGSYGTTDARP